VAITKARNEDYKKSKGKDNNLGKSDVAEDKFR